MGTAWSIPVLPQNQRRSAELGKMKALDPVGDEYTHKSLNDLNRFINDNPDFQLFYVQRANYYAMNSEFEDIQKCEIKYVENIAPHVVIPKVSEFLIRTEEFLKRNEAARYLSLIIEDLKKVLELAKIYAKFKEKLTKLGTLEDIYRTEPQHSQEYLARSDHLLQNYPGMTAWTKIISDMETVVKANPNDFVLRTKRVGYHRSITNMLPVFAVQDLDNVIKTEPNYATAYHVRGNILDYGSFEDKIENYTKAIRLFELVENNNKDEASIARVLRCRAHAYFFNGYFDEMHADFVKAISTKSKMHITYNNRAYYYRKMGNLENALEDFSRAIEICPEFADGYLGEFLYFSIVLTHLGRGVTQVKFDNDYDLAIKDLLKVANNTNVKNTKRIMAMFYLGMCYLKQERFEECILNYTEAGRLGMHPERVNLNRELAVNELKKKIMKM